jgi:integrase
VKIETNTLYTSKRFNDVAEIAIQNMQNEMIHGGGKVIYKDYIGALRKYHIPYFDRTYITSIDQDKILAFEGWRIEAAGRVPAKSTILTHNAAFSKEEYEQVYDAIIRLEQNSRKEKTRQIRELLLSYIEFAVHTGIRPGTEMDGITWADIHMKRKGHEVVFFVTVTKGKTTKYTGTREIVCRDEIFGCIDDLRERFPDRKPSDLLFRLADGSTTKELGKAFDKAVGDTGLKHSAHGVRTLYSLRHSYIT